jgi:amino acid adenylation domain-containing protein/non-ribosomal peptide synthase protein (TIGR01720 family)
MPDLPLSPGQEALWFLHRVAPRSAAYHLAAAARVVLPAGRGLDAEAFGRAFRLLSERHPELRATFAAGPSGAPIKRIHERLDPDFRVVDATGWSEREIADCLAAEAERPFDLETGPLARAVLLTEAGEPRLLFAFHHIVADFWSLGVVARELGALYDGEIALPPLRAGYDDHVRRERERLAGPRGERLWEHWSERLRDAPDLDLPVDRPRPPLPFHRGGVIAGRLDAGLADGLRTLARRRGATLFATLLAGFEALLSRMAGQTDFVVGSPSAGRSSADQAGTVGYFVRPLALRADLAGAPSGEELVDRARKTVREALANQALPFSLLAERLRPVRVPGKAPLFQTMLVFHQSRGPGEEGFPGFVIGRSGALVSLGSLGLDPLPLPPREVPFDLTLTLSEEADGGLAAGLDYSADLFDGTTALRTAERFERLLAALVADPARPVDELPLLGEAEAHQVLSEWNDTGRERSGPVGLYRRFAAQAERTPEAVALVWDEERITYRELEHRARGLAAHLGRMGVGPERIVGVSLPRGPDLVVSLLGVLAAGGAYLPLDPANPKERLEMLIEDSRASLVIGRKELDAAGSAARTLTPTLSQPPVPQPGEGALAKKSSLPPLPGVDGRLGEEGRGGEGHDGGKSVRFSEQEMGEVREPTDPGALAYVLYTSGSTGRPKGVAVTHGSASALLDWAAEAFHPEEMAGVFAATSIGFDLSIFELFAPLAVGGTVILGENVLALHGLPAVDEVTLVNTVPSAMAELLRQGPLPDSVRAVALAGEPLPAELVRRVREASRARVLNLYGPTEDTVYSTAAQVDDHEPGGPPIGRPLPGTRAFVLDANLRPAPIGVAGELWLAGAGLARGYLDRPDLTAERFLPDPHSLHGGRLYRTGDRARLRPDGAIELLGRIDHQVKVRGFRIELGEVEAALLRQPSVREAAAGVREVGGERVLAAWVVADTPISDLRTALAASLPSYMVPSLWAEMAALPRTPGGKVDRRALPEPERGGTERAHTPPRDPVEEALAAIWREVLEVEAVGVDESFFELGGHSLLAMRLLARVRRVFGVELPVHALFERPTIALLARAVVAEPPRPAPPLAPVPRDREIPLSYAQERLWFLDRLAPGSAVYNMPGAFRLSGPLNSEALARAFSEVVQRHEALRTRFVESGGRPVQMIDPPAPLPLPVIDLGGLAGRWREAESRRLLDEEARRPFDLEHGPLLRTTLQRLGPEDHRLQVTAHHIVADGWSLGLLAREVTELVRAGQEGRPAALPALPIQYADFARWQREWLSDDVLAFQLAAWRERLAGAPALLDLPTDRPRPAVQSFRGGRRPLPLPPDLTRALHALARSRGLSPFMVLAAALQTLLGRYARSEDVLLGTPVANRRRIETEPLIGLFVNTLVLRGDLSGDPAFGELLGRVRETALAAYLHQDLPFEKLVEELAPERSLSHSPLVQVVLVVEEPGWEAGEREPVETGTAKFDLTFDLAGEAGSIEFRSDLFDEATIDRLAGHFVTLLAGAEPERRLSELPLLTEAEQRQLAAWNETVVVAREGGLHERFERQAALAPEAVAVVFGDRSLTYGELDARANRLARRLRRLGVGPETPVGLCVGRSLELIVGILGTLKAGGAYVPLDPVYPRERLAFTLEDARPAVLLTEERLLAALPASSAAVLLLDREDLSEESLEPPRWETDPSQLAYVIYTSGSTGRPKGALVSHANVTRLLAVTAEDFGIGARDVWTMFHSHAFDFSVWEIWGALAFGGRLVIVPQAVTRSPEDFLRLLARERVTVLNQTPSAFLQLPPAGLPDLRLVIFGGEALEVGALDSWLARHGGHPRLVNLYGITETTVHVTWRTLLERDLGAHHSPIGVPIPDLSVHLLDRHGREVPVGVPGEIHVGGAGVGRGYLARPGLTAERFVPDPFSEISGARLYRSGDLARRRPDGQLDYLGRIDEQVKIRGFRIELGEIEAVLAQHPKVAAAAVALRGTGGDRRLVAYWVPREEGAPEALVPALRAFLKERLPEPMIPAAWVGLAEMPLNRSGKIDRRRLPDPQEEAVVAAVPLTPTEEILAGLWADLLGRSRFGPEDDFFAAGGHSLLVTQLVSRLRQTFGVEVAVRELFESPTLAGLAERIDAALGKPELAALPPIEPAPRDRPLPLSFAQRRLWLLDRLEPGGSVYNVPLAVRLSRPVNAPALERALGTVIDRHEALRTRFAEANGEPVQEVVPRAAGPALPRVDLSALPSGRRERELRRRLAEEAERPFDLAAGPVIRALLLDSVLAVTVHHIASDGWSAGVLVRELGALYRGETFPDLPIQYADFTVWQRRWLEGDVLENQLGWWRERLAGLPALGLWTDRPRLPVRTSRGRQVPLALPESVWRRAGIAARRQGSTPFMALLTALQALLARGSGQTDFGIGFPVANRRRPETEGLIGLFVNTLVLRSDLAGDPTGAELLRRTREAALGAYAHQDLPFEKLVEELRPERSLGMSPLFQVLLALNAPLPPLELGEITAEPLDVDTRTAKFDLSWLLRESGGGLAGVLEISSDLFDSTTAQRMADHFERLLAGMADTPWRRISDLPLLSEVESAQLIREWNDTGGITDAEPLPERIARQAERTPGAVALVAGAEKITYQELEKRAARLAGALRGRGVGPEIRVAVCLERSADLVAALLAVWKAGGAYVPLDPAWPRERLSWMLADSGATVAIGRRELLAGLAGADLPVIDPAEAGEAPTPVSTLPGALAYVLYTSGSTGRPKGVAIPHASVAALALWAREIFAPEELAGVLAATSVCFDLSIFELFVPLSQGGTVILAENALALPTLPAAGEVTLVNTVPSAIAELVRADALPATVRTVCLAGEPLRRDLVDRLHARPVLRVLNLYGPSEDTTYSTFAGMSREERGAPPIGRPIAGTRVRLLDAAGRLVPLGAAGDLCLGGAGLARGYLGRPELTAERFVPDPQASEPGARLYRTGDLARFRNDGQLEFLGRIDHQVKVRGFRIEPGEVEAALRAHPAVREAAVVVREIGLVAWLTAEGELPDFREWLLARLPEPFVPAVFAVLEALPLTPSGKVDRLALSKLPLPGRSGGTSRSPRTPLEKAVAAVWAETLGVERVGAEDDFFALGGHSLLAARVASRLDLPLRALFEAPTVEQLARRLETTRPAETSPLVPILREEDPPLSFAQERLWLLDRLEGGAALNMAAGLHLSGDLDIPAMAAALSEVARRHEVLRTSFPAMDGIPWQAIAPPAPVLLSLVDLKGLPEGTRASEAERLRSESALAPFDLAAAPPWRTLLLRRDRREHELLFAFHHIVTDGWSVGVLTREVGALYSSGSALPEPPVQYADFAIWQRRRTDEEALARWRERLAGDPPSEPLSPDRPRRARGSRAVSVPRVVPPAIALELRALARAQGASLYMVLLAALTVLLGRHGGSRDVVVGSPVAGRTRPEIEGLLGCFLNTLALRLDLTGNPSFRGLLARAREVVLEALADQDVPFERVLEEVRPNREIGRTPLFQALLNMRSFPRVEARLPGLDLRLDPGPLPPPRFDLTVYAEEAGDEIRLDWVWDADLFEPERREEIADQLGVLLAQIARDPDLGVEGLSLVTTRALERLPDPTFRIVAGWHGTVQGRFAQQALRRPDALAVVDREVSWTYGELLRGSRRLAHALRAGGIRPGDVVAIHAHRSAALVRAVLGVLEAGAVFLILDRDYPAARLAAIVRAARPKAWLQTDPAPLPPELEQSVEALRITVTSTDAFDEWPDTDPGVERAPDAPAYLAFTSGSTGTPKGIVAGQRPLSHFLDWHVRTFGLNETDRFSLLSGLSHDPLLRDLFTPLTLGATLVVPDPDRLGSPEWMAREAVTVAHLTPAMAQLLTGTASGFELPALRYAFFGGDALLRRDVDRLRALAPRVTCVSFYGATETPQAMGWHVVPPEAEDDSRPVPLGRGIDGVQLLVLNAAGGLAGLGETGEVHIRTPYLALGYLNDEALTRERFLPNQLYRTGDLGAYLLNGQVRPLGRADRQIKIRGFRVEPAEIEAALTRLPGVREAVVILRDPLLVGYVVPAEPGIVLSPAALRSTLRDVLPPYMVPASLAVLPALPLTPNGKVDRAALPDPDREDEAVYIAPRDPIEALLVEIWAGVLGVERVGITDEFFALGGHSLLATQVVSRVRDACGVDLPLRALFEAPTLESLARRIAEVRREGAPTAPPILRVPREGNLPLSFAQQRLWFLDQMEPGNPNLHLAAALHLAGPLDVPALEAALREVVRRHETLRTTFGARDGRPFQAIAPELPVSLPVADLQGLPRDVRRQVEALASSPFDLARGPLLRGAVLRLDEREHVLLLTLHHIVSDGWSTGVLFEELTALYEAFRAGRPSPLPELPVQYADFASWQREWMHGEVLDNQLAFWRDTLGRGLPVLELPTDRPRPAMPTFHGARRPVVLSQELARALQKAGRERGATLFMVLMAAFQALLHRYTGQEELLVGSPVANRTHVEVERLVGMFFNLLAFRADLADDPAFSELLARVRDSALAAYLHQDLPFEKLLEELQPERHLSRTPLFQVTLVLQNAPRAAIELPGLTITPLPIDSRSANFDLNLQLTEVAGEISGWLEYRTDLFDVPTVDRMAGHLRNLLEGAAANPAARISRLPLLSPGERFQLLAEWNDTRAPFPADATMHGLFAAQAARTPDAVAVLSAERSLTYRELDGESARLARRLRTLGVGPGVPVGVSLERSADMVSVLLGILRAGGFYVPLDSAWPEARIHTILSSLGVSHVLTHPSRRIEGTRSWTLQELEDVAESALPLAEDPEALAYVIFTSGSTGIPKGVMVQHRPAVNLIHWVNRTFGVGPGDRLLFVTSLAFDLSVYDVFGLLAAGGTVRVASEAEVRDPEALARALCREPVTFWDSAPAALAQVVPFLPAEGDRSRLRLVFLSGDWIPLPLPGAMKEAFPNTEVIALGGATEATVWSNSFPVRELAPHWVSVPYGRPIPNARYLVLDGQLEPCPIGVPGDLYIGGECLLAGYAGDPELSASKILPDPYGGEPGGRLYRTGDRARFRPDGNLEFLGRVDQQVKIRGYRIELGEIEAALLAHPAIRDAVAAAREEDGPRGDKRLIAYVVQDPSFTGEEEDEDDPVAQVDRWQVIYDEVYSRAAAEPADATLNLAGWVSSYTGEPLPEAEMRGWVEATVERILAQGEGRRLGRVLEIGCGTGMLLFRIALRCLSYHATDLSEVSLHYVRRQLAARGLPAVTLARRAADDWSGIEPGSFDTVILNSVTQHFPGADYLRRVVLGAVRAVAPGGFVFVGDVRSLPLLHAFHASVERAQAPGLSQAQLGLRVRQRAAQEEELLVDPRFFAGLPAVDRAEIQLKRGRDRNEMSRFRFDAVLHVGPAVERPEALWQEWTDLAGLRQILETADRVGIRGIPDDRLQEEDVETAAGLEPEDLWALGREHGYEVEVRGSVEVGRCDALFWRAGTPAPAWPLETGDAASLANNPLQGVIARTLVPRLRAWLADRVPEYMMPSAIMLLDALPLTANGKVDRRALPAPDSARREMEEELVAPGSPAERQLAAIWSEVLGVERVGVHDNFFELGGDSILSIQVIARAQQAGLRLSPRQIFQHQTVAELAAVAGGVEETTEEQGPVTGPVPITPIQRWFFEQELADPQQWNLAVMLELLEEVRPEHLDQVAARLLAHHDALRLRFRREGSGWSQWNAPPDSQVSASTLDLLALPASLRTTALESAAAELQKSLDLANGPLQRFALFRCGPGETDRLLLTFHHLVIDGVSWRILLEDLQTGLRQLARGEEVRFPPKTASYRRWAESLAELDRAGEAGFWLDPVRHRALPLPGDGLSGANLEGTAHTVKLVLDADETRALLREVPEAFKTRIDDVLLTALARAFFRWTGSRSLLLDLEGHGRGDLLPELDLSRTVGWFTAIYPVLLKIEAGAPEDDLKSVKEQLRTVQAGGVGYPLLRYGRLTEELARLPQAQVIFNNLGQLDSVAREDALIRQARESFGPTRSPRAARRHLLEVYASILEGRLELDVEYSASVHREATIRRLAGWFLESLRELIDRCRTAGSEGVRSFTPSDFPEADLDQEDLDLLMEQLG